MLRQFLVVFPLDARSMRSSSSCENSLENHAIGNLSKIRFSPSKSPFSANSRKRFRYPDAPRIDIRDPAMSVLDQSGQIDLQGLKRLSTIQMTSCAIGAIDGTSTPKVSEVTDVDDLGVWRHGVQFVCPGVSVVYRSCLYTSR